VAEPPLPSTSSEPPRRLVLAEGLLAQRPDLLALHQHRAADVVEHALEVVLLLGQERVQEARGAGVVPAPLGAAAEQPPVLEEHVHELPQHVVQGLDQLLGDLRVLDPGVELPLGAGRSEGDGQAAAPASDRDGAGDLLGGA
jgi:hypothetical protein